MGMSAAQTGRLEVRTEDVLRLVWHEDDDVVVPDGLGAGWVPADKCEVSDGAWVVSIRCLSDTQLAKSLGVDNELERRLSAVRLGFVDFQVVGEKPHGMKRRDRLDHFRQQCAHYPNLVFFLGWFITLRSQGIDPKPVMSAPFRDRDGYDTT